MFELSGFQRELLYVIGGLDNPSGLAINRKLGEYYEDDVRNGRLYPNLDELVERGLVEKGQKDERTNEYTVSERGVELLQDRRAWEDERIGDR